MKNQKDLFLLLISLSVTLFIGCQQQHNIEALKMEINSINNKLSKAIVEQDNESIFPMYTEDAISLPSYQPIIKGIEAIKANAEKEMPAKMNSFTLNSTDVWVSGNFVIDIGIYKLSMDMPNSPEGEWTDNGKYLTVFEIQKDGSLLMKADIWNTDVNPWREMMQHQEETDGK